MRAASKCPDFESVALLFWTRVAAEERIHPGEQLAMAVRAEQRLAKAAPEVGPVARW